MNGNTKIFESQIELLGDKKGHAWFEKSADMLFKKLLCYCK